MRFVVAMQFNHRKMFLDAIGDVERVDDRLDAGIGAPHRYREADKKRRAEIAVELQRDWTREETVADAFSMSLSFSLATWATASG